MKRMFFWQIGLSVCVFWSMSLNSQVSHTISFEKTGLEITEQKVENDVFVNVRYSNLAVSGGEGNPELPVEFVKLSVPYNATDFVLKAESSGVYTRILGNRVYPRQMPRKSGISEQMQFVEPNPLVYGKNEYLYGETAKIVSDGYLDGGNHIVTVAVYPVAYNPALSTLKCAESVTLRLDYALSTDVSASLCRPTPESRRFGMELAKSLVVNPEQVEEFASPISKSIDLKSVEKPAYEYCVITKRELAPAFDKLIGWKRQKGYSAGVVCIEDILSCLEFQSGDEISGINDDAGKLRAYLQYSFGKGGNGRYVLLAGDNSVLPIRYGYEGYSTETYSYIPTDLYFRDLNGNWDKNNNGKYGEYRVDGVDYAPELFVGRLLCKNKQEIENYVHKLLLYELNPGNGDFQYLKRAFFTACDGMLETHEVDTLVKKIVRFAPDTLIFRERPSGYVENPTFPTGSQCIAQMNKVRYGYFGWHGHGNPGGVGVKAHKNNDSPQYGILALKKNLCYHQEEAANGLDDLTNYDYPAITYSGSCTLTPFDIVPDRLDAYNIEYNVGASFTVGGLYGGPAFLGNTRYGFYGPNGSSMTLEKKFFDVINNTCNKIGVAEALSKFVDREDSFLHYCQFSHNLIGCPEFEMWTDIPLLYRDIQVKRTDYSVSISGYGLNGSKVAITDDSHSSPRWELVRGDAHTFLQVNPNSSVLIYRTNSIPYIAPLLLQNGGFYGKRYILASNVGIGKNVDRNRTEGAFRFFDNSEITIDAEKEVEIFDGTEFMKGSSVTFKSNSKVVVRGGLIREGAVVNIDAPSIEFVRDFEVERGGVLNINTNY